MPSILSRPEPLSMEKSKTLLGDDAILPHPLMFSLIRILGLIFVDPFRLNMLSGLNFQPVKHDVARLAPYSEVMAHWPRDNQSRLRFRRLEFVDEQATGAVCAINGNFAGGKSQEIVVARGKTDDLIRPDDSGKIQTLHSVDVFGHQIPRPLPPHRVPQGLHRRGLRLGPHRHP
ncbi:uncharacterized protein A4U43_C05F35860 [Asparagus officinalis]|uniref:RSE1/DDB1/CPSF1 first beta-propeller domain-containing protein n=1 Tax=Asparagus officinalis TaxID=4686 RepID=A0A5P1EXK3_ASPOF|nr:uncharacterized protein A4U43_C05F35860 [Asparagus officinalis]